MPERPQYTVRPAKAAGRHRNSEQQSHPPKKIPQKKEAETVNILPGRARLSLTHREVNFN